MRPARLLRTATQLTASAVVTAALYLAGPVLGMVATTAEAETLTFEPLRPPPVPVVFELASAEPDTEDVIAPPPSGAAAAPAPDTEPTPADAADGDADGTLDRGATLKLRANVLTGPERRALMRVRGQVLSGEFVGQHVAQKAKQRCDEPVGQIEQLGDGRWKVQRSFVESYTSNLKRLESLGAVARHRDALGDPDGFRLARIRCGSPLAQGGLENGDIVSSVNGHAVTSLAGALLTYAKVRNKDTVKVDLVRRGKGSMTLVYKLY